MIKQFKSKKEIISFFSSFTEEVQSIKTTKKKELLLHDAITEFEKQINKEDVELRTYFYYEMFSLVQSLNSKKLVEDIGNTIVDNVMNKVNDYYMLVIDVTILTALYFYRCQDFDESYNYFLKAVKVGEDCFTESKKNYFDALNCAYTWVGFYDYQKHEYQKALTSFHRVLELYDLVKDDPNYFVKEADSVPNSIRYIDMIKSIIE